MSITDELLENTAGHAWAFTHGALPRPPAKRVAVLACMDACLNVYGILGFEEPDAGVLRAVGGVVSDDAIGSLLASQRLLGLGESGLIHHPDCGVLTLGDDEAKAAPAPVFALLALADLDRDVRWAGGGAGEPLVPHGDAVRSFDCEAAMAPCERCWPPRRDHLE